MSRDGVVDALRALHETAGAAQVRNPPQIEVRMFGLSESHLRSIAAHFGMPVTRTVEDGRLVVRARHDNVGGRQLSIVMENERAATREDVDAAHRAQLAQLEGRHVG
jgi:hypothetical protein